MDGLLLKILHMSVYLRAYINGYKAFREEVVLLMDLFINYTTYIRQM